MRYRDEGMDLEKTRLVVVGYLKNTDLTLWRCVSRFSMRVSRRCTSEREDRGVEVRLNWVNKASAVPYKSEGETYGGKGSRTARCIAI